MEASVTNDELVQELRYLGIDPADFRVTMMLPLIKVAWADGEVQEPERAAILEIAERLGLNVGDGERVVRGWLANPPTEEYMRRGIGALRALARREGEAGDAITPARLRELMEQAHAVAKAAGGLFGLFSVDTREKAVLSELAVALDPAALPLAPLEESVFPPPAPGAERAAPAAPGLRVGARREPVED